MRQISNPTLMCWVSRLLIICLAQAGVSIAHAVDTDTQSAASLRTKYGVLQDQLRNNPFQKPLYLDSSEKPDSVAGDMYALIDYPFATVSTALNVPTHWCDILILHLNTKYCRASTTGKTTILNVSIGKKYDQPLDEAYRVDFTYRVATKTPNYLRVKLNADKGPISTRNYSIMLEAIPLKNGRTFIHLGYSYAYGFAGRLAMQAYLSTVGSGKVGFTVLDKKSTGQPVHIGGMRGVVERNTMRYYLAIEAFLGALSAPPQAQFEKRLLDWFTAVERYPRQLHEMEQSEYLDMKRKEHLRQKTENPATTAGRND
ncbi:MAG: hypothetical protein M3A44_12735 [Gammaproteobacteria bacterium]